MLKFTYKNATVYITKPTEKHLQNIRKSTKKFMQRVMKEEIQNGVRGHYRRVITNNCVATEGNKKIKG